jgi:hypothetical protein
MRGSTPAAAAATTRARGVSPNRPTAASDASSSAAAPSLSPDALPAVTDPLPSVRNAGRAWPAVERGVGAQKLVLRHRDRRAATLRNLHARDLPLEPTGRLRRRRLLLRAQRKQILIVARNAELLGHMLRRFAHGIGAVGRLHGRVHEAPAQTGVEQLHIAPERRAGLRHHEGRAGHALHAAGQIHLPLAHPDRARSASHRRQAARTQAIDRLTRHRHRQAGQQRRHARHIAIVVAGLVGTAEHHIGDGRRIERRLSRHQHAQHMRREVVGAHRTQCATQTADGRANAVNDVRVPGRCSAHAQEGLKVIRTWKRARRRAARASDWCGTRCRESAPPPRRAGWSR